jgi:hypothetical protein
MVPKQLSGRHSALQDLTFYPQLQKIGLIQAAKARARGYRNVGT